MPRLKTRRSSSSSTCRASQWKTAGPLPRVPVDARAQAVGDDAGEISCDAAAGHVREGMGVVAHAPHLLEVAARRREQVLAVVVLLLEHAADEREAVRVDARGGEADHGVPRLHAGAVDEPLALDDPHASAGEVELVVPVDPGKLGRLAADQRDSLPPADLGRTLDELRNLLEIDAIGGDVVEEDERVGARRRDVVDAVGGEVGPAGAQPPARAGEDQLRPDRVGGSGEKPLVVERMEARERPEARRAGGLCGCAEPLDDCVSGRQRDARLRVRLASAPHLASVCTRAALQ